MKLYYYPLVKLTLLQTFEIATHCKTYQIATDSAIISGVPCLVYITSTPTEEKNMRSCKLVESFSVLNIDNVLELLDFKKGNKNEN